MKTEAQRIETFLKVKCKLENHPCIYPLNIQGKPCAELWEHRRSRTAVGEGQGEGPEPGDWFGPRPTCRLASQTPEIPATSFTVPYFQPNSSLIPRSCPAKLLSRLGLAYFPANTRKYLWSLSQRFSSVEDEKKPIAGFWVFYSFIYKTGCELNLTLCRSFLC